MVTFAVSLCFPSERFVVKIYIPRKTLQNLETKAIETETEGVRREVLERERKVKKKKYKGNRYKIRLQRPMKMDVSESFAAQRIYNSRNEVFSDSTYLFLLREKI